jgi:hypothetical protein
MGLLDFEHVLREAAALTDKAGVEYDRCLKEQIPEWQHKYLKVGDWCKFCPKAPTCEALRAKANAIAKKGFEEVVEPQTMSGAELSKTLSEVGVLEQWAARVRAYAHDQATSGVKIPGWKLVAKRATRKWRDEKEAAGQLMMIHEIPRSSIYVEEMVSPAVAEKFMPGRNKEIRAKALESMVTKQSSGAVLVAEDDKRPALITADGSEFNDEQEIPAA